MMEIHTAETFGKVIVILSFVLTALTVLILWFMELRSLEARTECFSATMGVQMGGQVAKGRTTALPTRALRSDYGGHTVRHRV